MRKITLSSEIMENFFLAVKLKKLVENTILYKNIFLSITKTTFTSNEMSQNRKVQILTFEIKRKTHVHFGDARTI